MDVSTVLDYPDVTVDQVYALAVEEDFRAAVCVATGALQHSVDVRRADDGSATVTVRRTMPADVPDFVRRFVGDTIQIVQTEIWGLGAGAARRQADLAVQIVGQPAALTGTLTIEASGSGAREVVRGDLRVSIPFVAKKIETEIAKGILAAARKEEQVARQWLAARA